MSVAPQCVTVCVCCWIIDPFYFTENKKGNIYDEKYLLYVLSLQEFAGDGLRTLALAYKDLDEEYFNQWKQRHHEASTQLEDRERKLDELYEEIEMDLLVGRMLTL